MSSFSRAHRAVSREGSGVFSRVLSTRHPTIDDSLLFMSSLRSLEDVKRRDCRARLPLPPLRTARSGGRRACQLSPSGPTQCSATGHSSRQSAGCRRCHCRRRRHARYVTAYRSRCLFFVLLLGVILTITSTSGGGRRRAAAAPAATAGRARPGAAA